MEDQDTVERIKAKRTKVQKASELHQRKTKERAEAVALTKATYQAAKESPVLQDILEKAKQFAAYHVKLAQDGVGYRNTGAKLQDGTPEQELYYFDHQKRVTELDKSAGLLELVDYIERQIRVDKEK